jgi:rod shape-determining protein MreD
MVYLALRGPVETGAPLSWFLGLLKDVFSGLYLGLNAFTFLAIFVVIKNVSDRLYAESGELFVVTVSAASLACVVIDLLLLVMFTSTPAISYSMTSGLIPHVLINAFAASLVTLLPIFSYPQDAA